MLFLTISLFTILSGSQIVPISEKTIIIDTIPGFSVNKNPEQKMIDTILSLPEIKKDQEHLNKNAKEKRNLKVFIYKTPKETGEKYYWIKVGEDNGSSFVSHFNFYIYPGSFTIKYLDTMRDEAISLSEWRRRNKKMN